MVLGEIASGGMGVVYSAYDPELDRKVALKMMRVGGLGGPESTHDEQARLVRESRAMARLSHPHVVAVHDVGVSDGSVFLAMDLVDGRTLKAWLTERERHWREIVQVLLQAGQGLAAAHEAGLVHRDFKPGNVLIANDGRVFVTDFGLARTKDGGPDEHEDLEDLEVAASSLTNAHVDTTGPVTAVGMIVGTPGYMAPEQVLGAQVDARTDQYSYCATLYRALYGKVPYDDGGVPQDPSKWRLREPPGGTGVPGHLRRAVLRGLSLDPAERHPSMASLFERLRDDSGRAWRRRGVGLVAVTGLVLAGWGYARIVGPATTCESEVERLQRVWGPEIRGEAEAAFGAIDRSFAAESWKRVDATLERFVGEWDATRIEACEATHLRGEQSAAMLDRRMWCLDRALDDAAAVTKLLGSADASLVMRAPQVVAGLPEPGACRDLDPSEDRAAPPEDPDARAAVTELAHRQSEVEALERTGRYPDALALAEPLAQEAHALEHDPSIAEAEFLLGRLHTASDALEPAEAALLRALRHAERAHMDGMRVDIMLVAAHLSAGLLELEQGRRWHALAVGALERLEGPQPERWATEMEVHSVLAYGEGDISRALSLMTEALARRRSQDKVDFHAAADVHNIGVLLSEQSRHREALEYYEQAVADLEAQLGPEHPQLARVLGNAASSQLALGRFDDAIDTQRRAVQVLASSLGDAHPLTAQARGMLAFMLYRAARLAEAAEIVARACHDLEAAVGTDDPMFGHTSYYRGWVEQATGRFEEALATFTQARALIVQHNGPEYAASAIGGMGEALLALGRPEEAIERLDEARTLTEQRTKDGFARGYILMGLGTAQLRAGRIDDAVATLEGAVELLDASIEDPIIVGRAHAGLAEALWDVADARPRASSLAVRALAELDGAGARVRVDLEPTFAWLDAHATR